MGNSPQETFFADREFMMLPTEGSSPGGPGEAYDGIIRYAKTKGVRYILVNKNTHETNPGFMKSIPSADLREVYRKADQALVIYEVIH